MCVCGLVCKHHLGRMALDPKVLIFVVLEFIKLIREGRGEETNGHIRLEGGMC